MTAPRPIPSPRPVSDPSTVGELEVIDLALDDRHLTVLPAGDEQHTTDPAAAPKTSRAFALAAVFLFAGFIGLVTIRPAEGTLPFVALVILTITGVVGAAMTAGESLTRRLSDDE